MVPYLLVCILLCFQFQLLKAFDLDRVDMMKNVPMRPAALNDRSSFVSASFKNHSWTCRSQWHFKNEGGVIQAFDDVLSNPSRGQECVVVDVGVNAGFYSLMSASYGCTVYGFELQRDCIDIAVKFTEFDKVTSRVHLFQNLVSDTNGQKTIKYTDNKVCDGNFGFTREDCSWCDFHKIPQTNLSM